MRPSTCSSLRRRPRDQNRFPASAERHPQPKCSSCTVRGAGLAHAQRLAKAYLQGNCKSCRRQPCKSSCRLPSWNFIFNLECVAKRWHDGRGHINLSVHNRTLLNLFQKRHLSCHAPSHRKLVQVFDQGVPIACSLELTVPGYVHERRAAEEYQADVSRLS
jgi:hypothetical protein